MNLRLNERLLVNIFISYFNLYDNPKNAIVDNILISSLLIEKSYEIEIIEKSNRDVK